MHYKLFSIGPITVYSYGLMIAIGFIGALALATWRAKKFKLDKDEVWNLWILCLIGGLLGAKILYVITEFKSIINSTFTFQDFTTGFVVYGGIIGGLLSIYVYCRIKKLDFIKYMDLIIPSVPLGQGFGRLGCLLAGCCYGRETTSAIGITFRNSPFAPNNVSLFPTQIISSLGDFAIMGILLYAASRKPKEGIVTSLYFILYGIGRFIVEIFRNDPRGVVGTLSTSQFISIFIVLLGIFLMWRSRKKAK